jgi:hypothetical protein
MKNFLVTLAAISLGTIAVAQKIPPAPQYSALKTVVPAAPVTSSLPGIEAMPIIPAVPLTPAIAVIPEIPLVENYSESNDSEDDGLTKSFSKTFQAGTSDKISVNNQFGSITVKTWDRKEVKADVTISAYSNNAGEQQKLLEDTRIEADKSGDQISFRTQMNTSRNGNWGNGTRNGKKWRREVRVNYTLYVPSSNALNLSQQYGNVEVGSHAGPVNAKVQYGDFNAQKLSSANNNLNVQYGKMTVQDLNKANLKQQYGGGITLGTARDINVSAQYSNVTIERLIGEGILNVQYNKLRIGEVAESSKVLTISAQYGGVDVGFSDSYKGRLDVRTSYGGFKFGAGVSAKVEGDDEDGVSFSKSYNGNINGGGSGQVSVKSAYGSVTFR